MKNLHKLSILFVALAACALASTGAYNYACTIPGGSYCESINPECDDPYSVEWQALCCGSQEIPNTCCDFYCYKYLCANGEVCGRTAIDQEPGNTCQNLAGSYPNMVCQDQPQN